MKNLVRNTIRSFKNNKISIVGLVFLLFFGLGAFCVMSNTTTNIKNEYNSISTKGNLHSFTASELYDVGSAGFMPKTNGISYTVDGGTASEYKRYSIEEFIKLEGMSTSALYHSAELPEEKGTYYIPLPDTMKIDDGKSEYVTYVRNYNIYLDENLSSGLYKNYAKNKKDTRFTNLNLRVISGVKRGEETTSRDQQYVDKYQSTQASDIEALAELNIFADDYQKFVQFIEKETQTIFSAMTTKDTPLSLFIQEKYANELDFRFFKSLNVTATKDNIFYKIVDSNVEDTIDKIVLFEDTNKRKGHNLYSVNDWAPFDSFIQFYDTELKVIEPSTDLGHFKVPSDFNSVATLELRTHDDIKNQNWTDNEKFVYSQVMQIRFKRMLAGARTTKNLDTILKILASTEQDMGKYAEDFFNPESDVYKNYDEYVSRWYTGYIESITISANGNVVFQWTETFGTPQSCTLSNWTGKLSVVNPQHLSANKKTVINPAYLNSFEPYKVWYKNIYSKEPVGEIDANAAKKWLNTLSTNQINYWIDPAGVTEMSYESIPGKDPIVVKTGTGQGQWNGIDKKHIASCGGYNQVIWGCGLTPDFMYPVVDITRPTPNVKTECIVYCNDAGYNTIKLAFVNSPVEEYLLAKYKANVSSSKQHEILNTINEWAKTNMILPKDVKCAYAANDTSNVLNCAGFRVAYIPNLVKVIDIVALILTVFIGVLSLVICFVIIKRYVERNRVNIGIMRANGISKTKIAFSLFPFALLPAILGGVGAYVAGLLLQAPLLSLFKNYWTLPTPLIGFNWITLVSCILLPFLIFSLVCFLATLIVLKTKAVELMKPGTEFKTNGFSRVVKKPFKHFGILTRFRVSLAFNSLNRLVMMSIMSCLTMASLVFAFTTFDKLNQSKVTNSTQFNYSFSLQLTTPTTSGSTYSAMDYDVLGATDPQQFLYNVNWNTADPESVDYNKYSYEQLTRWYAESSAEDEVIQTQGNIMLPSAADMQGQNQDLLYLADKVSSRLTLDYTMGVSFAASNPWEIALSLMPANSRNLAADAYKNVSQLIGERIATANYLFEDIYPAEKKEDRTDETAARQAARTVNNLMGNNWCYIERRGGLLPLNWYYVNALPEFVDNVGTEQDPVYVLNQHAFMTGFGPAYTQMICAAFSDEEIIKAEYPIHYRTVPVNWDSWTTQPDELYTYVTGNIKHVSSKVKLDDSHEIKVEGIVPNSRFVKLTDKKGHKLNDYLYSENYLKSLNIKDGEYPVIINAYAAHKYKLNKGDVFTVKVNNLADRYERKLHPEKFTEGSDRVTFRVVATSVGTNNEAFYTTQECANKILGLPDGKSWNKTHRYMIWQENPGLFGTSYRQLVDLAGIGAKDEAHISRFTFQKDGETIQEPIMDSDVEKKAKEGDKYIVPVGFNGIYTANDSGKPLTNQLTLYSYTGMYPGTSVYRTKGSVNKFAEILMNGTNLAIANKMSCIDDPVYYKACNDYINSSITADDYRVIVNKFIDKMVEIYGETTMITAINGAMDVAASDLIYKNLISTFDLAQTSIMAIIIPITIIIVGIISNLIITDSKKMAAMLKALGYSDRKNIMSILAMFIPTIVIGLALAIPLSFGITLGYQSLIFNGANILVDVTQKWWYYVGALAGIGVILMVSYLIGYSSLKRDRLVDQIK